MVKSVALTGSIIGWASGKWAEFTVLETFVLAENDASTGFRGCWWRRDGCVRKQFAGNRGKIRAAVPPRMLRCRNCLVFRFTRGPWLQGAQAREPVLLEFARRVGKA